MHQSESVLYVHCTIFKNSLHINISYTIKYVVCTAQIITYLNKFNVEKNIILVQQFS